jgi:hypothetical protein
MMQPQKNALSYTHLVGVGVGFYRDAAVLAAQCLGSLTKHDGFKPQELANTVWALGKLDYRDDAVLAALCDASVAELDGFKPQELANTMWALGKLMYRDDAMLAALCQATMAKLDGYVRLNLENTMFGLAELKCQDVLAALCDACVALWRTFNPKEQKSVLGSLEKLE